MISEPSKRISSASKRPTKLERYRQERAAALAGAQRGLDVATDDFYVLIEVEELKYQLEVEILILKEMLMEDFFPSNCNIYSTLYILFDSMHVVDFESASLQVV